MAFRRSVSLRPALLAIGLVVPTLGLGALSLAQENNPEKHETAGKRFKNIKVLKDLPADQLIPVMHKVNVALGVKCDFCHVIGPNHTGFDKDDKPEKEKARQMIIMTVDINKRFKTVDKKVYCFTCHQGHPEPANPPAEEQKPPK